MPRKRPTREELEKDLAENHEPSKHAAHEDVYVAIRDAFNAAGRKLQDYARRRRGKTKIARARAARARGQALSRPKIMVFSKRRTDASCTFTKTACCSLASITWSSARRFILPKSPEKKAPRQAPCAWPGDKRRSSTTPP